MYGSPVPVENIGCEELIWALLMLRIVRAGHDITYISLNVIGNRILEAFRGPIKEFKLASHQAPVVDSIDAYFLTKILHQEYEGHISGITDADLKTHDEDEIATPFAVVKIAKTMSQWCLQKNDIRIESMLKRPTRLFLDRTWFPMCDRTHLYRPDSIDDTLRYTR
jgi:hypothetical protein